MPDTITETPDGAERQHSERVFYIASNFHASEVPDFMDELNAEVTDFKFPGNVTLGFRGIFWSSFQRLYRRTFLNPPEIDFLGLHWRVSAVYVFELPDDRFPVIEERLWVPKIRRH